MDIVELDRLHPGRGGCPSLDRGGIGNLAPHAVGHLRRTAAGRQLPVLGALADGELFGGTDGPRAGTACGRLQQETAQR